MTPSLSYDKVMKVFIIRLTAFFYQYFLKKILFTLNPEHVHNRMTHTGELLGKSKLAKNILSSFLVVKHPCLRQTIAGISFTNPIGLSAGFDYEARLTQILPSIGFGFETVGTITHFPFSGNVPPRLGRLPKSKSLMVNKGFKNLGAQKTSENLSHLHFKIPVGVSVGRTNTFMLETQRQSIEDIIKTLTQFEESKVRHSYYELNISCPNLYGNITFYPPQNLKELLIEVDKLNLKKPMFIKMPIEKSNKEVKEMLEVISNYSPAGVIFGNLQKDRTDPAFDQTEVKRFNRGNFSGKPTFNRSNELIGLAYRQYKDRFIIIGSGGVFSAEDAYKKITLGASLVQLITGMIFQGPQLITQINSGLIDLLKADGFTSISEAVGSKNFEKSIELIRINSLN